MNTKSIHWRGFLTEGMDLCQRGARTNYVLNGAAAIGHSGDQGCSKFWFFWCKCTIPGMTLTERNKENTLESLDDSLDSDICIYIHTLPFESFYKKADIFFAKQVHRPQLRVFQEEQLQNFQPSGPNWSMTGQAMAVPRLPGRMPRCPGSPQMDLEENFQKNKTCLFLREHF